jgi:hypothetical protein
MHVYLCSAKQYLYFIWPVSLGTLFRLCYGTEIAVYILRIREVSRRSVAIGTSLQHRVSLFEKGAKYRSYKQAWCAREFRQKFPYTPVPNTATLKFSSKLKRFDQQLQFQTVRESAEYKLRKTLHENGAKFKVSGGEGRCSNCNIKRARLCQYHGLLQNCYISSTQDNYEI